MSIEKIKSYAYHVATFMALAVVTAFVVRTVIAPTADKAAPGWGATIKGLFGYA